MHRKRIKGSRKFNQRLERARTERARRLGGLPPDYPPDLPRLRRRIVVEDFDLGRVVRHELKLYRSSRADCYVVEVDGRRLPGDSVKARGVWREGSRAGIDGGAQLE